ECLQPIGSFNLRGALSAVRAAAPAELAGGVVTASAGNMAQGVAWAAREAGVRARVVAPENAPRAKLDAVERLGGELVLVPHEVWWQTVVDRRYEGVGGGARRRCLRRAARRGGGGDAAARRAGPRRGRGRGGARTRGGASRRRRRGADRLHRQRRQRRPRRARHGAVGRNALEPLQY